MVPYTRLDERGGAAMLALCACMLILGLMRETGFEGCLYGQGTVWVTWAYAGSCMTVRVDMRRWMWRCTTLNNNNNTHTHKLRSGATCSSLSPVCRPLSLQLLRAAQTAHTVLW